MIDVYLGLDGQQCAGRHRAFSLAGRGSENFGQSENSRSHLLLALTYGKLRRIGLMRCIAKEVAPRGIRVNTVNPGPIDNALMRAAENCISQMFGVGDMSDQIIPKDVTASPSEFETGAICLG